MKYINKITKKIMVVFIFIELILSYIFFPIYATAHGEGKDSESYTAFTDSLPKLSEEDAKSFLCFVYNVSEYERIDDDSDNSLQKDIALDLLTGNYTDFQSVHEIQSAILAFSVIVRGQLNNQAQNAKTNLDYLSDDLLAYFEDQLPNIEDVSEEIIIAFLAQEEEEYEAALDAISNDGSHAMGITIALSDELSKFQIINSALSIYEIPSKVSEYVGNTIAIIETTYYVFNSEFVARAEYFNSYLSNRPQYESADDFIFQTIMDYNEIAAADSYAASSLLWIAGKESWVKHRADIDRWAETLFLLESKIGTNIHHYVDHYEPATCEDDGVMTKICEDCGESIEMNIPAFGHDYDATVINPAKEGEAEYILYTCKNCGHSYTEKATRSEDILVDNVSLSKTEIDIKINHSETIEAAINPEDAMINHIVWISSNEHIATVSPNGLTAVVSAISEGTATITATATNGTDETSDDVWATCIITVSKMQSGSDDTKNETALIKDESGNLNYYKDGEKQTAYTGLVYVNDDWWYVEKGVVAKSKIGFVDYEGSKFVVVNGNIESKANGLVQDPDNDTDWYYCAVGQVQNQYTGLAQYNGAWFYINKGKLDTKLADYVEYDGGLFYVAAGRIMKEVNGLAKDPDSNDWYYLAEGQAQIQYSGLAFYDGEWFYVISGKLAEDYSGPVDYDGETFNIINGMVR